LINYTFCIITIEIMNCGYLHLWNDFCCGEYEDTRHGRLHFGRAKKEREQPKKTRGSNLDN
jgi:hypothetical protein